MNAIQWTCCPFTEIQSTLFFTFLLFWFFFFSFYIFSVRYIMQNITYLGTFFISTITKSRKECIHYEITLLLINSCCANVTYMRQRLSTMENLYKFRENKLNILIIQEIPCVKILRKLQVPFQIFYLILNSGFKNEDQKFEDL